ncbi:hypothetical protein OJAV_G00195310 [Oryzias javanicus]|uniref:Adhesion G-protein coupled receptor G2 n=1 Tax=Oryzias javanicus TaxID=123683 RepID=A0A437C7T0_ORYJA|nr:hypothetical protein OJAV_G00195310 [Oryzias javanicus]
MFGLWSEGNYRWKPHFLPSVWILLLAAAPRSALGSFLADTKAVLIGCEDQWTLQSAVVVPRLFQMTVCVDVHVVVPGAWAGFLYTSVRGPNPDLGLEGDATAIYGWLLQVRHRFPLQLTPLQWHRVCLRRDAEGNSFILEVDGRTVAERTVIAQAIPPSGTLWLGCHPRLQPPGAQPGRVELYLFRMWADLNDHGLCEDGSVIGWDSRFWSVTGPKAKAKDPYLLCEKKRFRREASETKQTPGLTTGPGMSREYSPDPDFTPNPPNLSSTVRLTTPPITTAANHPSSSAAAEPAQSGEGSPVLKCDTRQLCSNHSSHFWVSVTAEDHFDDDLQDQVSKAFSCENANATPSQSFTEFCRSGGNVQVVDASCSNTTVSTTTCGVLLLLLKGTVSACDLQLIGESALQPSAPQPSAPQPSAGRMRPTIRVQVERVGQNLCEGLSPSEGSFVRCSSTSSLEDICRSNAHSNISCSILESDSPPVSEPGSSSCTEPAPTFCDCSASCTSTSQFYAMKLNIRNNSFNVNTLKNMFLPPPLGGSCTPSSLCHKMKKYEVVRLECHGTSQRLYSCMVTVEMSGPVDECALRQTVQEIVEKNNPNVQIDEPLSRMMVCGSAGSSLRTLLESNLTWAASDLQRSDVCGAEPTLPLCEAGETLAVLLTDVCPSQPLTTQPPTTSTTTLKPTLRLNNTTGTQPTTLSAHSQVFHTNTSSTTTVENNVVNTTPPPPPHTLTTDEGLTKKPDHTTVTQLTTEHHKQTQTVVGEDANINTTDANNYLSGDNHNSYTTTGPFVSQSHTTQSTMSSLNNNYTTEKNDMTTETSNASTQQHTADMNKHTTVRNTTTQANNYSVHTTSTPNNNHTTRQNNDKGSDTTSYNTMSTHSNTNTTPYITKANSDNTTSDSTTHNNDTRFYSTTPQNEKSTSIQSNTNAAVFTTASSRDKNTTLNYTTSYNIMPNNDNTTPTNINTTLHSANTSNSTTFSTKTQHNNTMVNGATTHSNNNTTLIGTTLYSTKTPINNPTTSDTTTLRKNDTTNATTQSNFPSRVATTTSINVVTHPTVTNNHTTTQTSPGKSVTTSTLDPLDSYTDSQQFTSTKVSFNRTGMYNKTDSYTTNGPLTSPSHTTHNDTSTANSRYTTVQFLTTTIKNPTILDETTTKTHNTTTNKSPEITDKYIQLKNTTTQNDNSSSEPTSSPPLHKSTPENNDTIHNTSTLNAITADPETTATQNHTTVHNYTNHSIKSAQYNNSVTTDTGSTLSPTASYTDSQQMSSNYTQEYKETSNYTTTGPLTSSNYTTGQNYTTYSNAFDSYTTTNNVTTTNDISIISNYTTPESPSSVGDNRTTERSATSLRNIYTTGYNTTTDNSDTTEYETTPTNNFTTNITTLSSIYTTMHSTTPNNDNTTSDSETTITKNYTTPHSFTNVSNKSVQYNTSETTSTKQTPTTSHTDSQHTTDYTLEYNGSKGTTNYSTIHSTTPRGDDTTSDSETTTIQNYTTVYNFTNKSLLYNSSGTTETISTTLTPTTSHTDSQHTTDYTQDYNGSRETSNYTTVSSFTTENDPTQSNVSTPVNSYTTIKDTIQRQNSTTHNTTIIYSHFTTPATLIGKTDDNATTTNTNDTARSSNTTPYVTTHSNSLTNTTNATLLGSSSSTHRTTTPNNNYTTVYNTSTTSNNHPTTYETTTQSKSNFTVNNTTANNNPEVNIHNTAISNSNTTANDTTTPGTNGTEAYSLLTTTTHNTTPSATYKTLNNATLPESRYTTTDNTDRTITDSSYTTTDNTDRTITDSSYTTTDNTDRTITDSSYTTTDNTDRTITDSSYTTTDNTDRTITDSSYTTPAPAVPAVCPNKTTTCSTTVAPIASPQNITNTVSVNTTVSSAATQKPETTPTKNPSVENLKSSHTTKPPQVTTNTTTVNTNMYVTPSGGSIHTTTRAVVNAATTTTTPTPVNVNTTTTKAANVVTAAAPTSTTTSKAETQLNSLTNLTVDASQLSSSEISDVVKVLDAVLQAPNVSKSSGQKVLDVISNLLDADGSALSGSANSLIKMVDRLGVLLRVSGDTETVSATSLVLAVRTVDSTNFVETSVDVYSPNDVQLSPSSTRSKRSASSGSVSPLRSLSSASPLGSVSLPSSLLSGLSPEERQNASRVQFTFYTKSSLFQDISLNNQTNVSQILGSSVANLSIENLKDNIRFSIRNPGEHQIDPQVTNATCVFWDYALNDEKGGWRSDGCFVVNVSSTYTTCSCNHLTSFAVLLDLSREGIMDRTQAEILTFITYIGCGISSIFLSVTLLTYLLFLKLLQDIPAKILVQLSLSLLLLNLVFLLDSWLSLYDAVGLCISTAFFLHYFLLTSFTWAGLEALHMYLSIVRVFTPYLNKYMLKFSLMGWGIPLFVVIVVIAVDKNNYGPVGYDKYTNATANDFCWLRNDIAFYVGVVAYFLLVFVLCLLVFIVVMHQLSRIKKQNPHNQAPNRSMVTDMRSIVGLVLLLGLSWGFALFAWGPLYLPFVYLFSIFNSLQGFFLFVFHCAVKENVRRQWRIYLCCGKLRLPENQDWSRTATNNRKTTSRATATTSNPMSNCRGSVASDVTNSSGSAPADSGISSGSNIDVLLNEIHVTNLDLQSEA